VNQQSEHLSDAQVEQYGKRSSGAGPETVAWVEGHLDDCPLCRSRVLDFQRTRFALLLEPQVKTVPTSDCPSENDVRNLAAGLCPEPLAQKLRAHIATCNQCGPLLQEYIENFSNDFSSEEQALLNQLSSSSPEWQKQTAREMLKQAAAGSSTTVDKAVSAISDQHVSAPGPSAKSLAKAGRRLLLWKWIMAPVAAAACAILAFSIWYTQRDTPEKVEQQLAQAYTENRALEMRIPHAKYADFNQRRSGESESRLNSPASMNQAITSISEHLKKEPDNPQWLMLSARFDLLDWNPKSALTTLDQITEPQLTASPEYLMTRALALYEEAEISQKNQDYDLAVELLSKALQKSPDDPVLLFNRAVGCEKILAYECATGDWVRFLQVEKDPKWLSEGRSHLDKLKEKKTLAH
jgi:tetratricopeptide (TPR) repeat protein